MLMKRIFQLSNTRNFVLFLYLLATCLISISLGHPHHHVECFVDEVGPSTRWQWKQRCKDYMGDLAVLATVYTTSTYEMTYVRARLRRRHPRCLIGLTGTVNGNQWDDGEQYDPSLWFNYHVCFCCFCRFYL